MDISKLQVGDVIFYRDNSFIGKAICKISKSDYSHVAMYMGNNLVLEANKFITSRLAPLVIDKKEVVRAKRYIKTLSNDEQTKLLQNVYKVLNRRYGYMKIVYLFFKLVFNLDLRSIVHDLNTFICTELVDYEYSTLGIDLVPNVKSHVVSPYALEFSPNLANLNTC